MIDLHSHSNESDGTYRPAEIVSLAQELGLRAVALTDHDTMAGIPEFLEAGRNAAVIAVPGVEMACRLNAHHVHIVGLYTSHTCEPLQQLLSEVVERRDERNITMLEKLNSLGCSLTLSQVQACQDGAVLGRPHFAQAVVRLGHCATIKDVFDRYLARGKPAYVPRVIPDTVDAIAAIHAAGGVAIWAHPLMSNSMTRARLERCCVELKEHGLDGLETRYSEYTMTQQQNATAVATKCGLLQSGGSDCHGERIPGIHLGYGRGSLSVPDEWLEAIRDRAVQYASTMA